MKTVWLVIPCYNEKEVLPETSKQLKQIMQDLIKKEKISSESRVAFVNDGSKDTTWNIISQLHEEDPIFVGINLAHNKGHQNALFAGLQMQQFRLMRIYRMMLVRSKNLLISSMKERTLYTEYVRQEQPIQSSKEAQHMHFIN